MILDPWHFCANICNYYIPDLCQPLTIIGNLVENVSYLKTQDHLNFTDNIDLFFFKAMQRLHLLRKLKEQEYSGVQESGGKHLVF